MTAFIVVVFLVYAQLDAKTANSGCPREDFEVVPGADPDKCFFIDIESGPVDHGDAKSHCHMLFMFLGRGIGGVFLPSPQSKHEIEASPFFSF